MGIKADSEEPPYTIHTIENSEGKNLGHVQITDGNYINWSANNRIEKGATRKLIAKLLYENKYPSLVWEATSPSSVRSYEKFCKEYPDLVDKIQFTNSYNKIDIDTPLTYAQEKGALNEGSNSSNAISKGTQVLSGDSTSTNIREVLPASENEGRNWNNKSGVLSESNSTTNERGSLAYRDNESRLQSSTGRPTKIDINLSEAKTTEDLTNSIFSEDCKPTTPNDVKAIMNKTIELEPEISGTS